MANDGLRKVNKSGIVDGAPIEAHHVSHIVDTLNGDIIRDVKLCGSLTLEGSMYNSDTIFSKNFQASSALTVKGDGEQLIFLDKDNSNYIRFRDAGGTVNRGYIGFVGSNLIINHQQSSGNLSLYRNNTESLRIDTSNNISIPNGDLSVGGVISGDGSGLTNLNLAGADASQLSNLPASSVWNEEGSTATYIGTAVATNFQGDGSGLTNINGDNVEGVVKSAAHADTADEADTANFATTAGTANSVDGENVNGAVANATNATYAETAGAAPWNGTIENTQATITNNNSYSGFLLFKDSDYAEIDIAAPVGPAPPQTTTTYSADAWIQWQGRTKTIDRTMSPGGIESYSDYENKFRIGIDTQGRFRIVRESDWSGCLRIERDSSKIIIDQGLTVSAGGSTITGASSFSSTLSTGGKLTVSAGGAEINGSDGVLKLNSTSGASFIEFFTSDKGTRMGYVGDSSGTVGSENITLGKDSGASITLGASSATINKQLVVSSGGVSVTGASSISSTLSTGGKLTVTNGGARIDGNSNFEDNLTIGYGEANYNSTNVTFTTSETAPEKHIIQSFYRANPDAGTSATAAKELKSDETSTADSNITSYAKLAVNGTIKADGYYGTSDERLKNLIGNYNPGEALNTLNKITPKLFKWNELSHASGLTDFGFFAQEVEEVFPFGVVTSKTDNFEDQRSINPMAMVALASAAIKDLSKENEILKDRNRELEDRLKLIEEKLGL